MAELVKLRKCVVQGCGALTPFSRCEEHAIARAEEIKAERERREPWRYVYGLQRWKEAREAARRQAGWRCERCGELELVGARALDVHHRVKLAELWRRAGGGTPAFAQWLFEDAATNLAWLLVLCDPCHARAEIEAELGDGELRIEALQ